MSEAEIYKEALIKINQIVTRKYVMRGRLAEIHDVIEVLNLPEAIESTALPKPIEEV